MTAPSLLDYYLLVELMASGGGPTDRDSLIAVFREAHLTLTHQEYMDFQEDVRVLLEVK